MRRGWPALALAVAALAGCAQQTAPDVMLITRDGSIPGAHLSLRVTDDGRVSCNRKPLVEVTSKQLISARGLAEDLSKPAKRHLRLAARPGSVLSYSVRTQDGTVRFADNSLPRRPAFSQVQLLARQIAQGPCRLAR